RACEVGYAQFFRSLRLVNNEDRKGFFEKKFSWRLYGAPVDQRVNRHLDYKQYTIENGERFCLQSSPIEAAGGEAMTAAVRKGQALYYWIYPNLMLNWYEGYLDTNLVLPLGVDKMRVIFEFYFDDVSKDRKSVV